MPKVRPKESRNDFLERCIPVCMDEGLSQRQAIGKCEGMYNQHKRGGIARALKGKD